MPAAHGSCQLTPSPESVHEFPKRGITAALAAQQSGTLRPTPVLPVQKTNGTPDPVIDPEGILAPEPAGLTARMPAEPADGNPSCRPFAASAAGSASQQPIPTPS